MHDEILCLAMEIDTFVQDYDPYGYGDAVEDSEMALQQLMEDITNGNVNYLLAYHKEILEEHTPDELEPGAYERVENIVRNLEKFAPAAKKEKSVNSMLQEADMRKQKSPIAVHDLKEHER